MLSSRSSIDVLPLDSFNAPNCMDPVLKKSYLWLEFGIPPINAYQNGLSNSS